MISVITPAYKENKNILLNNLLSVKSQKNINIKCLHNIIFDGINRDDLNLNFLKQKKNTNIFITKHNHSDYGDYVRRLGTKISILNKFKIITYLDADNTFDQNHLETVLNTHRTTKKNIIVSKRKFFKNGKEIFLNENESFIDSNVITLFQKHVNLGLYWGCYPKELSLIGDRIFSKYILNNFNKDIAYTNMKTVNYNYSMIDKKKIENLKNWYNENYLSFKTKFRAKFGFDIKI